MLALSRPCLSHPPIARALRTATAAAASLGAIAALTPGAAQAQVQPSADAYVTNGVVSALARGNGATYLGGDFTRVGPRKGHAVAVSSGSALPRDLDEVAGGDVLAAVPDGNNGWYLGGTFTSVGGVEQASLAHLEANGDLDPDFDPSVLKADGSPGEVRALVLDAATGTLYLGGDFRRVDSPAVSNRSNLAGVDAASGDLDATVAKGVLGTVNTLALLHGGVDPNTHPRQLVVGGSFALIGGVARSGAAALALEGVGAGQVQGWNPELTLDGDVGRVNGMVVVGDASDQTLYMVGSFNEAGSFFDVRANAAAYRWTSGAGSSNIPVGWAPELDDEGLGIATSNPEGDGDLYLAGGFGSVHGVSRDGVARVDTSTGATDGGWDPQIQLDGGSPTVRSIAVARGSTPPSDRVVIGGMFDDVAGEDIWGAAQLDLSGAPIANWDPRLSDWANVVAVNTSGLSATRYLIGGEFTAAGPGTLTRRGLAKVDGDGRLDVGWDAGVDGNVRALAVVGGNLFVGGDFTEVGGTARANLAKVAALGTATVDPDWAPEPDGAVVALAPFGGTQLVVGGGFGAVGGSARSGVAKVSQTGTGAVDPTWDPGLDASVLAAVVDDDDVYLGGDFTSAKGGTFVRNGFLRTSVVGDGTPDGFDLELDLPGVVHTIDVFGMDVYAGGRFSEVNGGLTRQNLVRARTDGDGLIDQIWNPSPDGGVGQVAVLGDDVYVGGEFEQLASTSVPGIGRVSRSGTGVLDPTWDPTPAPAWTAQIAPDWDTVRVGGGFESVSGVSASGFAQLPSGRGATPVATIDLATSHDFGTVDLGQRSAAFGYTIVNVGNVDLTIDSISATSPAFEVEPGDCPVKLAPGATCSVSIEFVPQAGGAVNASLVVDTDGGDPSVGLQGTGKDTDPGPGPGPGPDPVPDQQPKGDAPAAEAPMVDAPIAERPEATPRAPKITVPIRCARPSRSGVVRLPVVVRSERPLAVAVSVDYAAGTKGLDRCPKPNADRRFEGDVRNVDTLKRVPIRAGAAAVMVDHRRTIELKLKPGLYRVTVRAHVAAGRMSKPTRRWIRVLNP